MVRKAYADGSETLELNLLAADIHVTPTIAGLLYDDVAVTGGPIVNGAFVSGQLLPSDRGNSGVRGFSL